MKLEGSFFTTTDDHDGHAGDPLAQQAAAFGGVACVCQLGSGGGVFCGSAAGLLAGWFVVLAVGGGSGLSGAHHCGRPEHRRPGPDLPGMRCAGVWRQRARKASGSAKISRFQPQSSGGVGDPDLARLSLHALL